MTNSKKAIALMLTVTLLVGLGIGVGGYFLVSRLTSQKPEVVEKEETRVVEISEPGELENEDLLEYVWYEDEYIKFQYPKGWEAEVESGDLIDFMTNKKFGEGVNNITITSSSGTEFAINNVTQPIGGEIFFRYKEETPDRVYSFEYGSDPVKECILKNQPIIKGYIDNNGSENFLLIFINGLIDYSKSDANCEYLGGMKRWSVLDSGIFPASFFDGYYSTGSNLRENDIVGLKNQKNVESLSIQCTQIDGCSLTRQEVDEYAEFVNRFYQTVERLK
jgi:hypothetical protein